MGITYRVRQALATFDPRIPHDRRRAALLVLSDSERALFDRLAPVDVRHSLAVYEGARAIAPDDRTLWRAALLHDVGKGRPSLIERAAVTLLASFTPWLLIRWTRRPLTTRRGRLARLASHTEASARYAELAGSDPDLVATLRSYGDRAHARGRTLAELDASK